MKILHFVASRRDHFRLAPVMRAITHAGFARQQILCVASAREAAREAPPGLPLPDDALFEGAVPDKDAAALAQIAFERMVQQVRPDWIVVSGHRETTVGAAFVAARLRIPLAVVEAGVRTGVLDEAERNRMLIERLADRLFTSSAARDERLVQEGLCPRRIHRVGNVIVDSMADLLPQARLTAAPERMGLEPAGYVLVGLRRKGDTPPATLQALAVAAERLGKRMPVVMPLPEALSAQLDSTELGARLRSLPGVHLCQPEVLERLDLAANAALVITDSGHLQETTSGWGIPCLTVAPDVERPVTVTEGSNNLVGPDATAIVRGAEAALSGSGKAGRKPRLWDGRASERIAEVLQAWALQRMLGTRGDSVVLPYRHALAEREELTGPYAWSVPETTLVRSVG